MRKVLVTGGAGFIGAHLTQRLAARGTAVLVLDNLKRAARDKALQLAGLPAVRFVEGDIRNASLMAELTRSVDVVFHLAAQSNVMGAGVDPEYSISTNVLGTVNVLRAASAGSVRRVVFTSSREVYGDAQSLPVREDAPLLAKNLYGASKIAGEAYARALASPSFSVDVLRLANVYGAGDSNRVIPLWLTAASTGRDLLVYGGEQVLDFLWVGTCVDALIFAGEHGLPGPINVGSGMGTSILDLAQRVLEVSRSRSRVVRAPAREVEVAKFVADTRRMGELGLSPDTDPLAYLAELVPAYAPARPIQ